MESCTVKFQGKDQFMAGKEKNSKTSRTLDIKKGRRIRGMSFSNDYNDGRWPLLLHVHYDEQNGNNWIQQIKQEQQQANLNDKYGSVRTFPFAANEVIYGFEFYITSYGNIHNLKVKTACL